MHRYKMSEQIKGKIQTLRVQNFTCFEDVSFEFSTGINLFIGENGTGKTHILKLLYAMTSHYNLAIYDKIGNVLKTQSQQFLRVESLKSNVTIQIENQAYMVTFNNESSHAEYKKENNISVFDETSKRMFETKTNQFMSEPLFIPCIEMLSLYPGFISAYNKRENSFDETHYDLALALNANPLRNSALREAEELSDIIEKALNIKVIMENDKFYIVFKEDNNRKVAAPLAAEGIKKLGQMIYLIRNGSLTKDTILFWDEPEVNLNPKYIRLVADFLMALARQGVQIFVATHDYLLTQYLSIKTEYHEATHAPPMKFFSFYKTKNGTKIEVGDTLSTIQNNVILDEYAALYELEGKLFQETMKK
jgi:predicted ATP-dependent endonuclease of OLD family